MTWPHAVLVSALIIAACWLVESVTHAPPPAGYADSNVR